MRGDTQDPNLSRLTFVDLPCAAGLAFSFFRLFVIYSILTL